MHRRRARTLQKRRVQIERDVGPRANMLAARPGGGGEGAFRTPFWNNSRQRGEEKGLGLWDAISVRCGARAAAAAARWEPPR